MKRYMLFGGILPQGGFSDFQDSFDDFKQAIDCYKAREKEFNWGQIVDNKTWLLVWSIGLTEDERMKIHKKLCPPISS